MRAKKETFETIAEEIYKWRSNNAESNRLSARSALKKHEIVLKKLLEHCPKFEIIIANILVIHFGSRRWTNGVRRTAVE